MNGAWIALFVFVAMTGGMLAGWLISRSAYRETIDGLRKDRTQMEEWLATREKREGQLLMSLSDKIGLPSDPDLGKPRTISRGPRAIAKIVQDRRERERIQQAGKDYQPIGVTGATQGE